MSAAPIEQDVVIDAPPEVVWEVLTDPAQIVHWFADRVELDVRPGGTGRLVFEPSDTSQGATAAVQVEAVDRPRRFSFRWGHEAGEQADPSNSVLVEFTLASEGETTRLRVVEVGLDQVEWPAERKDGYARDHDHGWRHHLGRMREHVAQRAAAR